MKYVIIIIIMTVVGCGAEPPSDTVWRSMDENGETDGSTQSPSVSIEASLRDMLRRLEEQERELAARPGGEQGAETLRARARDIRSRLRELSERQVPTTGAP